jgi:LmbE family N-acetylglucosaminyl deacetylase
MPSRPLNILIVAAHPADSFDQAGGTLAHHVARGDSVTAVIATTGVRSHHWKLADQKREAGADVDVEELVQQAVEEKLEEVRKACRILGFEDLRDLGFEDDDVLVTQDKIDAIADVIRDVKPDILISHHPYETGGLKMHATIGQCTVFASQIAGGSGRGRQKGHKVPVIYFMNPQSYVGSNSLEYGGTDQTDLYVDITDVIEKKVKALDRISSQFYGGPYSRKRSETSDGAYGQSAYVAYAESFQRFLPQVLYYLPITEHEMEAREQGPEAGMGRRGEIVGGLMPLPPNMAYSSDYRVPKEKYVT